MNPATITNCRFKVNGGRKQLGSLPMNCTFRTGPTRPLPEYSAVQRSAGAGRGRFGCRRRTTCADDVTVLAAFASASTAVALRHFLIANHRSGPVPDGSARSSPPFLVPSCSLHSVSRRRCEAASQSAMAARHLADFADYPRDTAF